MGLLRRLFVQFPILLFSITVHEYAHGLIAEKKGDDTARVMGRLTLNPLAHIDPIGTLLLPMIAIFTRVPLFGWAKPVPVNPYRLYNPRTDMVLVGLAGPVANLCLAVVSSFGLWLCRSFHLSYDLKVLLDYTLVINVILAVFNLVPIPPLDGSRVISGLLPPTLSYKYELFLAPLGFFILLFLLTSGILWYILGPAVDFVITNLGGGRYI